MVILECKHLPSVCVEASVCLILPFHVFHGQQKSASSLSCTRAPWTMAAALAEYLGSWIGEPIPQAALNEQFVPEALFS